MCQIESHFRNTSVHQWKWQLWNEFEKKIKKAHAEMTRLSMPFQDCVGFHSTEFIIMYDTHVRLWFPQTILFFRFFQNKLKWIQFNFWPDVHSYFGYRYMLIAFDAPTHFECQFHNNNHNNVYFTLFLLIISYIYLHCKRFYKMNFSRQKSRDEPTKKNYT